MQQYRRLPLSLPHELYEELERFAQEEDRDPIQQARKIVREALEKRRQEQDPEPEVCAQSRPRS
jgi:metal-responsive CopG/Arc/MetJ family transcriptional regulator